MNRVVHYEIHATDLERAKKFYSEVFGWEMQQMGSEHGNYVVLKSGPGPEEMAKGATLNVRNAGINGGMMLRNTPTAPEGAGPNSYVCIIGVDDIASMMAKIEAAGGKPQTDKMDVPGVGQLRYYKDPEGNLFGIIQPMMPA
jgi:predicted enzyme related to lactoylglutathione lyase